MSLSVGSFQLGSNNPAVKPAELEQSRTGRQLQPTPPDQYAVRLRKKISHLSSKQRGVVLRAFSCATGAHAGQLRLSGEPYITHPLAVAIRAAEMNLDYEAISAALLHDVVEDTTITLAYLRETFGEKIAYLVDGLTKLDNIRVQNPASEISPAQSANFQKLVLATAQDLRVVFIKFFDRLHNLATAQSLDYFKRRRLAKETMLIYAPLANRLGMEEMRMELEDLSFAVAYPMRYQLIKNAVEKERSNRQDYIKSTIELISKEMKARGIKCRIRGRRKNLAGIYHKITLRANEWTEEQPAAAAERQSLQEIMDVYGIRIILAKLEDCYRVVGIMHAYFKPINGRFKDYIANPKKNGYQSLHTTLVGPKGFPLEVQIRTEQMERVAYSGVAAHFIYKDSAPDHAKLYSWLQQLARIQESSSSAEDFWQQAQKELSIHEIFVYTPKGELISLPERATPIDFAYAVHTDLGAKCIACEIDRVPAPLNAQLSNGQVINIITDKNASPDISWSASAVTPKALSHIASYANVQQNIDLYSAGEKMLIDALINHFDAALSAVSKESWAAYLEQQELSTREEVYKQISTGKLAPLVVAAQLVPSQSELVAGAAGDAKPGQSMEINDNLATIRYARCCRPLPGDKIIALSTRQDGINVHRASCKNAKFSAHKHQNNLIAAHWDEEMDKGEYLSTIRCEVTSIGVLISIIVSTLSAHQISINEIVTEQSAPNVKVLAVTIYINNRRSLLQIIRRLRFIKGVTKVTRA